MALCENVNKTYFMIFPLCDDRDLFCSYKVNEQCVIFKNKLYSTDPYLFFFSEQEMYQAPSYSVLSSTNRVSSGRTRAGHVVPVGYTTVLPSRGGYFSLLSLST